jgi:hypothetical protein
LLPLLVLALAGCGAKDLSVSVEVPKDAIQDKVQGKFPLETSEKEGNTPLDLTLSDPVVLLEDGKDRIGLRVKLDARARPLTGPGQFPPPPAVQPRYTGTATVFASVRYDQDKKALVLSDPKVTELSVDQLPKETDGPLRLLAEKALAEKFAEQPIPLPGNSALEKAVKSHLKSVSVNGGRVVVDLGL